VALRCAPLSQEQCLKRWRRKTDDVVLVDRPGRGYGDDYTPWLVDAPVGELVHVRAAGITEEGILAAAALKTASSARSSPRATT